MRERANHPSRDALKGSGDPVDARLREAFEPDASTVDRVCRRALGSAATESGSPVGSARGGWGLRLAVAGASSALIAALAVGVWRIPSTEEPPLPPEDRQATLVISNESGFVTVTTGGSQWIVLPGDTP